MMILLNNKLNDFIKNLVKLEIPEKRKAILHLLIDYIHHKLIEDKEVNLNFICTHNSRRSQFSQIWGYTAAAYYGIKVNCYSGGTEVTAINERVLTSIKRKGFFVSSVNSSNSIYKVAYNNEVQPLIVYSKIFDDQINKTNKFAAVMNCANADENCTYIPKSEKRISIQYKDPKIFDNTPLETKKYEECSLKIASELFYVFRKVSENI